MTVTLNVFSNVASPDPARNMTPHAIASFCAAFGPFPPNGLRVRLFVDPAPHPEGWDGWVAAARATPLPIAVYRTHGLADGYRRSIALCETRHAMQLEHDFVFLRKRIDHTLPAILAAMGAASISFLRFNKRANRAVGSDAFMTPQDVEGLPCCRVPGRSNNPHIIDVAEARRTVLDVIPAGARGAFGLEGYVEDYVGGGHVYGGLGHPATVGHLDGRRRNLRDAAFRTVWLLRGRGERARRAAPAIDGSPRDGTCA